MTDNPLSPERILRTAFFTGHRILPEEKKEEISRRLYESIEEAYSEGYRTFFCGCALGFDTLAALEVLRLRKRYPGLSLSLAIPCLSQADRWTEKDREIYREILDQADEKHTLSPAYYQGAMMTRNRYMADRSSLCICYLRHMKGGTASTVRYAIQCGHIRIINLAVSVTNDRMREQSWNYISTSPSAGKNAHIAPLHLMSGRKLSLKDTQT